MCVHSSDPFRVGRWVEQGGVKPGRMVAAVERCPVAPAAAASNGAVDLDDEVRAVIARVRALVPSIVR